MNTLLNETYSTDTDENVIEHGTSNGNFILLFIFYSFDV